MRADGVVLFEPDGDGGLSLADGVKPFGVQHLAAQRAVEALIVSVLPRRSGIDAKRRDADLDQPVLKLLSDEIIRRLSRLSATVRLIVVGADVLGLAMFEKEREQSLQHVMTRHTRLGDDA